MWRRFSVEGLYRDDFSCEDTEFDAKTVRTQTRGATEYAECSPREKLAAEAATLIGRIAGVTEFERELRGIGHKSVTSAQRVNDKIAVAKSLFSRMTKLSTALSAVSIRELQVAQEECEAATIKIDKREYLQRLIQALLLKKSWLNLQGLHQYLQEVVGDSSVPGVGDFWSDILCYANRLNQQTPPRRVDELDRMLKAMIYVLSSNTICNN